MCIESKSKWSVYSDRHLIHRWIQSSLFAVQVNGSWQNVMPATSMSTVFLVFVPWSLTKYLDLHHFESKLNDIFCHGQGWGIRINSWWVNVCYGQLWIEKKSYHHLIYISQTMQWHSEMICVIYHWMTPHCTVIYKKKIRIGMERSRMRRKTRKNVTAKKYVT